jgi:hypothetical protein
MKYFQRIGDFLQINLDEWFAINMQKPESYKITYGNISSVDGAWMDKYCLRISDISCIYKTNPTLGFKLYIETNNEIRHEFVGSITTIGYLFQELNSVLY